MFVSPGFGVAFDGDAHRQHADRKLQARHGKTSLCCAVLLCARYTVYAVRLFAVTWTVSGSFCCPW
jgi:hypothetical protein